MINIPYSINLTILYLNEAVDSGISFVDWFEAQGGKYIIPTEGYAILRFENDEDATVFKLKFRL